MTRPTLRDIVLLPPNASSALSDKKRPRLQAFEKWLQQEEFVGFDRYILLRYGSHLGTRRGLRALEECAKDVFPSDHPTLGEIREAVLDHERRYTGQPMKIDILSSVWWRPFIGRANTDSLGYERLKFVDKWLAHLHGRNIASPVEGDYLEYFADCTSAQPLVRLKEAFRRLGLPAVPSIAVELPKAITRKRSQCAALKPVPKKTPAKRVMSVPPNALPEPWQEGLTAMRSGQVLNGRRPPAAGVVRGIEAALCQYAYYCEQTGSPSKLTLSSVGGYLGWLEATPKPGTTCARRPATLEWRASALLRAAVYFGAPEELIAGLKSATARHQNTGRKVRALKHDRLDEVGSVSRVLNKAVDLRLAAAREKTVTRRRTRLNHATAIAVFRDMRESW